MLHGVDKKTRNMQRSQGRKDTVLDPEMIKGGRGEDDPNDRGSEWQRVRGQCPLVQGASVYSITTSFLFDKTKQAHCAHSCPDFLRYFLGVDVLKKNWYSLPCNPSGVVPGRLTDE